MTIKTIAQLLENNIMMIYKILMDHVHYKLTNISYYHLAFLKYSFYPSKSMTYYLFLLNFIS